MPLRKLDGKLGKTQYILRLKHRPHGIQSSEPKWIKEIAAKTAEVEGYFSWKEHVTTKDKATRFSHRDANLSQGKLKRLGYQVWIEPAEPVKRETRQVDKVDVIGYRCGWMSGGLPSHVHRTIDGGMTTCCGHEIAKTKHWTLSEVPRKRKGRSMYCQTCFKDGGKTLPWIHDYSEPASW